MTLLRALARSSWLVLLALPLSVSCEDSGEPDADADAGSASPERGATGGSNGLTGSGAGGSAGKAAGVNDEASANGAASASGGTSANGASASGGAQAGGTAGAAPSCDDVECDYGSECEAGECVGLCEDGQVFCDGGCIDPLTDARFCGAAAGCDQGAGPNPQTTVGPDPAEKPPVGAGGAGGAADEGEDRDDPAAAPELEPTAGEYCAEGVDCRQGLCAFSELVPGRYGVVERDGFKASCGQWDGNVCLKPYISIPDSAMTQPTGDDICVDDTTTLRPLWVYDWPTGGAPEAQTFCWIATGSSEHGSVVIDAVAATRCGWLYGVFSPEKEPTCTGDVKWAEVDSPGDIADIVWGFEPVTDYCRAGWFTSIECNWGS